jgi:transposase-like protein
MKKTYTSNFKAKVVLEALREEGMLNEIAGKYEVHPNQLSRWKRTVIEGLPELLEDKRRKDVKLGEAQALTQELYTQIGELSAKLNWLKKKSGIEVQ